MLNIVLYQPEIPPNTGNIMRLAANAGASLALVKPLGFDLSSTKLKRAGLDYREWVSVRVCGTLDAALSESVPDRTFAFSTKGIRSYTDVRYCDGDTLVFGSETHGLPVSIREQFNERVLRIPMQSHSRSINLSNAVAIALYEAWRQIDFA